MTKILLKPGAVQPLFSRLPRVALVLEQFQHGSRDITRARIRRQFEIPLWRGGLVCLGLFFHRSFLYSNIFCSWLGWPFVECSLRASLGFSFDGLLYFFKYYWLLLDLCFCNIFYNNLDFFSNIKRNFLNICQLLWINILKFFFRNKQQRETQPCVQHIDCPASIVCQPKM